MPGLDYTAGCVNFRDVGEWVELIAGSMVLPHRHLLRGGKLDHVADASLIGNPRTILNVRRGPDKPKPDWACRWEHIPLDKLPSDRDCYDASNPAVRLWLHQVVELFARPTLAYPVFVHCTSGKDRTGMAIGVLLRIADVPLRVVEEEYALSDGGVDVAGLRALLASIGDPAHYFPRIDLAAVARGLMDVDPSRRR